MRVRRGSVMTGAVVVALLAAVAGWASGESARLARAPCFPAAAHAKLVHFGTRDGLRLAGFELGSGRRGVVLAHQYLGDACQWGSYGASLARSGYHVVAFDFRGFGRSPVGPGKLDLDVLAAAAELRRLGARKVVLIGASMGGTAVLVAAPEMKPPPAAVVSLSGPASFALISALDAVPRSAMPQLFAVGAKDFQFSADPRDLYRRARSPKRLLVVPTGDHGVALLDHAQVTRAIDRVLRDAFG